MSILYDVVEYLRNNCKTLKLSSTQKVILYTIAARIGKKEDCWQKQITLAEECQISERQLRRDLKELKDKKIIIITEMVTKKGKQNRYKIDLETINYRTPVSASCDTTTGHERPEAPPPTGHPCPLPTGHRCPMPQPENVVQLFDSEHEIEEEKILKRTLEKNNKANKQLRNVDREKRFEEFWLLYPRKIAPKVARRKWASMKCDLYADEIIENVKIRVATEWATKDKQFIPHPTTFLNQERWKDEPEMTDAKYRGTSQLSYRQHATAEVWNRLKNWG